MLDGPTANPHPLRSLRPAGHFIGMGEVPAAASNPEQRITDLFLAHGDEIHRFAQRRVGLDEAPDVVSDTFLVAWRRFEDIPPNSRLWLLGVARRVAANRLRGRHRFMSLAYRLSTVPVLPAASDPGQASADRDGIRRAMGSLRPKDQEALVLVAWDGLSNQEAGDLLGCSADAFANRLHRARSRLATSMAEPDELAGLAQIGEVPQ